MKKANHSAWLLCTSCLFLGVTMCAAATEPVDAAQRRRDSLQRTLTENPGNVVASLRKGCVRGIAPSNVRENLKRNNYWVPDAVDECVTILTRLGRDGTLDAIYRTILMEHTGSDAGAETLAGEIAGFVMESKLAHVPLARGVALKVTTALAFDAGFTNGYRDTSKPKSAIDQLPQEALLKRLAERCLDLKDATNDGCYSAGYVYGLRAAHGELVAAAR